VFETVFESDDVFDELCFGELVEILDSIEEL